MITIRKAYPTDAKQILEYLKQVGSETDNLTFGKDGIPITVENEEDYLQTMANSLNDLYLLAIENDKIVGSCTLSSYKKERLKHRATIGISILKDMWGKKVGTKLLKETLEFAKNSFNIEIISLEVRSDNIRAINLYKKFGFEKIGKYTGLMKINGEYIDCDIMELKLKK